MSVSLRALAVLLCVAAAVAIGALTLSVSVTRAVTVLHAMGDRHAMALADVLRWEMEHFFELPSVSLDIMKNASRLNNDGPVGNPLQTRRYLDQAAMHLFLQPDVSGVNFVFYDGTRIIGSFVGNGTTRFEIGFLLIVERYFDNADFSTDRLFYNKNFYVLHTTETTGQQVDMKGLLNQAYTGTFNGAVSGWLPQPVVLVISDEPSSYNGIITPLRNPSRELIGFSGPAVLMDRIQQFLKASQVTSSSYAFVLDKTRGVIFSTSCPVPFESWSLVPSNTTTVAKGCILAESSAIVDVNSVNPSTSNGSTYLYCRALAANYAYAPLRALVADRAFSYAEAQVTRYTTVEGAGYFAASTPVFVRYPNVFLQLMVTMPETEVVGDIETPISVAVGVSVAVALVAAVVIVAMMAVLLQPIVDIADELDREDLMPSRLSQTNAALFELSLLSEVRHLQLAHSAMRRELERIQGFVPVNAHQLSLSPNESTVNPMSAEASTLQCEVPSEPSQSPPSPPPRERRRVRFREGPLAALTAPSLTSREVAVLCANVNGFQRHCQLWSLTSFQGSAATIAQVVHLMVDDARRAVHRHAGVIERFNGDHVVASFNANVFSQGGRPDAASRSQLCSSALNAGLELIHGRSAAQPASQIRWRVGVAHGSAVVGLAGTDSTKATHIIGSACTHAATLEQLGKVHRVHGVLVSDRFIAAANVDATNTLEWRVVGSHVLPGQEKSSASAVIAVRRAKSDATAEKPTEAQNIKALKLSNAERMLRADGRTDDAAQVAQSLTALLGGDAERQHWERYEALRWSNIPALERLYAAHGPSAPYGTQLTLPPPFAV